MPRTCFVLQLRPDKLDEYRSRHQHVWPEMLAMLRETGWRNYSLFLRSDGLLVGYLEPDDFAAIVQAMDERDVNKRWQAEVAGLFSDLVDGRPDLAMEPLEEVFHLL